MIRLSKISTPYCRSLYLGYSSDTTLCFLPLRILQWTMTPAIWQTIKTIRKEYAASSFTLKMEAIYCPVKLVIAVHTVVIQKKICLYHL